MIEKRRNNMDKSKSCAALLTDLSKAFDHIMDDFLAVKLEVYSDCNWTRTQHNLVRKRTLNHLARLVKLVRSIHFLIRSP